MAKALGSKPIKKDWYEDTGTRGQSKDRKFKSCFVVKHGGASEQHSHPNFVDRVYTILPYNLNNVPLKVAQEFDGLEGYDILSLSDGNKYINRAREIIVKNNKDVYDWNEEHRGKKGFKPRKLINNIIPEYQRAVSPYTCYLDALAKKSRGRSKKDKKE